MKNLNFKNFHICRNFNNSLVFTASIILYTICRKLRNNVIRQSSEFELMLSGVSTQNAKIHKQNFAYSEIKHENELYYYNINSNFISEFMYSIFFLFQRTPRGKSIVLVVSLAGIKVCSPDSKVCIFSLKFFPSFPYLSSSRIQIDKRSQNSPILCRI